jgi:hypothetical protein
MQFDLAFYLVRGVLLILLVVLPRWRWRGGKAAPADTKTPQAQCAPKPFAGLIRKPECLGCEQEVGVHPSVVLSM